MMLQPVEHQRAFLNPSKRSQGIEVVTAGTGARPEKQQRVATGTPPVFIDRGPIADDVITASPVELSSSQWTQLARFRDLLLGWNERVNLTAITDPADVERLLFLDALRMVPAIRVSVARSHADRPSLIDIGTGAGFPGLPIAIAIPEIDVTLLDATAKKINFIREVIADLKLANAFPLHGRSEDISHVSTHRDRYDFATARAVAALPTLAELAMPLIHRGGRAFFPKSADIDLELEEGTRAATMLGARISATSFLPHAHDEKVTRLVIMDKIALTTPSKFPRRAGIPAREPLGRNETV
ncbi:16S rRNA (guanine(527)-N(7))-methyltransferase RsmG [soil metagenome]